MSKDNDDDVIRESLANQFVPICSTFEPRIAFYQMGYAAAVAAGARAVANRSPQRQWTKHWLRTAALIAMIGSLGFFVGHRSSRLSKNTSVVQTLAPELVVQADANDGAHSGDEIAPPTNVQLNEFVQTRPGNSGLRRSDALLLSRLDSPGFGLAAYGLEPVVVRQLKRPVSTSLRPTLRTRDFLEPDSNLIR